MCLRCRELAYRHVGRDFDQLAPHGGSGALAGDAIVKKPKPLDRHGLEGVNKERRLLHQLFESCNCHLVQPAGNLAEACGAVISYVCPPANQRSLRENQVRPGKNGKQMSAQRVIPGRIEACEYHSFRLQELVHSHENGERVAKMLEAIEGHDDICSLDCVYTKVTYWFDTFLPRLCPRPFEHSLANIDPNDSPCAVLRQGNRIDSLATTEVDNYLSPKLLDDLIAQHNLDLGSVPLDFARQVSGFVRGDPRKGPVLEAVDQRFLHWQKVQPESPTW